MLAPNVYRLVNKLRLLDSSYVSLFSDLLNSHQLETVNIDTCQNSVIERQKEI